MGKDAGAIRSLAAKHPSLHMARLERWRGNDGRRRNDQITSRVWAATADGGFPDARNGDGRLTKETLSMHAVKSLAGGLVGNTIFL
jgi:hypothetical protein